MVKSTNIQEILNDIEKNLDEIKQCDNSYDIESLLDIIEYDLNIVRDWIDISNKK